MDTKRITIDGKEILFINAYHNCPSGFVHETELYIDGWQASAARCYYINRTWERYRYQSVMLEAVNSLQRQQTEREKKAFKRLHGIKSIMERHKTAFDEYLQNSENMAFLGKIEEALR